MHGRQARTPPESCYYLHFCFDSDIYSQGVLHVTHVLHANHHVIDVQVSVFILISEDTHGHGEVFIRYERLFHRHVAMTKELKKKYTASNDYNIKTETMLNTLKVTEELYFIRDGSLS